MPSGHATPLSRRPLAQLVALVGLAAAATTAVSFQLGSARAYDAISRQAALAAEQPALVARAGLLAEAAAEHAEPQPRVRADLDLLIARIEATHEALTLRSTVEGWEGWDHVVAGPMLAEVDGPLKRFIATVSGSVAEDAGAMTAGEIAQLSGRLMRIAATYDARRRDVVQRQGSLAMIGWGGVIALATGVAATLLWPSRVEPAARAGVTASGAPRYLFIGQHGSGDSASRRRSGSIAGRTLVCIYEPGLRAATSDRLGALGLDVRTAAALDEAREAIEAQAFGLFVTDTGGVVLARRVKAAAAPARAACIAIASASEDARALRAAGADVVVARPLQPMELETAAAFAIGAIPARRAAA